MEFSNNNPQNKSLAEIREEAYKQGREDFIAKIRPLVDEAIRTMDIIWVYRITEVIAEQMKGETDEQV